MTRKVTLAAALATLALLPPMFTTEAFAAQTGYHHSRTTATPAGQRNGSGASTRSINAYVRLFEKGNTAGDVVCTIEITKAPFDETVSLFKHEHKCSNDEAVSISFSNIPAGSTVSLYDDKNCGEKDDWVKFSFLSDSGWTSANSLEESRDEKRNDHIVYRQAFHNTKDNRLEGKVSCMTIHVPEPH